MTIARDQAEKAERFSALHREGCFILPNAWDFASAALIAEAGFAALATTSSGVAFANGLPDGEHIGRDRMIAIGGEIARRIPVPVTIDLEAGYGPEPEDVATSVRAAIAAGAVGCNIEDHDSRTGTLFDFDKAVARVKAGVEAARQAGLANFVLNARTDPFLLGIGDPETCFAESVRRANAFLEVGAGSAFVPSAAGLEMNRRLAEAVHGPLNVMASAAAGAPPLETLKPLGVRRISLGGGLMQLAYAAAARTLADLAGSASAEPVTHGSLMALMKKYA
ncbi:isocitrate lyase/PEP mutase family protein [Phenylobacterium montanum]|uniref:Isocitrate lyase/phosphoenolpyruvate mutase family protein n=1 Tax=Phenylobacterium montanum TaxID=2823693 RepID=A0A975G3C6_9CAUL|nr:isocitrate lyase/phosphoenolpyruvate mutase family protein [Caulobacter sp. S6]QUD89931.1 isocitrate lyase/phosphoenolpyruvate mutase family protein [Caulobacter sp. S6]